MTNHIRVHQFSQSALLLTACKFLPVQKKKNLQIKFFKTFEDIFRAGWAWFLPRRLRSYLQSMRSYDMALDLNPADHVWAIFPTSIIRTLAEGIYFARTLFVPLLIQRLVERIARCRWQTKRPYSRGVHTGSDYR